MDIKVKPMTDYKNAIFDDHTEMYEFGRLARYLIDGIANELAKSGYTAEEITELLASKWLRKSLDGNESLYQELGNTFGATLVRLSWHGIAQTLDSE